PVKLHPATSPRDVRFHEFARGTARRVRHRRVVEEETPSALGRWTASVPEPDEKFEPTVPSPDEAGRPLTGPDEAGRPLTEEWERPTRAPREVDYDDVVKGFEVEPGRYVMLEREELEALRPVPDRTIHIEAFVPLEQIDPVYFERSYFLAPSQAAEGPVGGERAYGLLLAALQQAGRVGVGRFVMRTREYLAAVRPMDGVLGLETLFFADEVRKAMDVIRYGLPESSERELNVAMKLIDVMASDWDPDAFADTYRQRVMELIRQKAEGLEPILEEEPPPRPELADLLDALRRSVEEVKERKGPGKPSRRGRRASG
ncbi:MAG: Ku protein, partial [Actinomycetota bacterium]